VCYEPFVQPEIHSTTILSVRRGNHVIVAGDGQVTLGNTVVKGGAKKVRRLGDGRAIGGFAGSAADGIALFERLDEKLREQRAPLRRAAVELAKEWRTDRALRRLEAFLVVADHEATFLLSGAGDVITPDDGIVAVGSGGPMALAAARALVRHADRLDAATIAREALRITSEICIYTNDQIEVETLPA
jgi:ATP-dependent HslUV protease, peptidase subunit HslV